MKPKLEHMDISRDNKLRRGLWNIVWTIAFRPSPRPAHGFRRALLSAFGATLDKTSRVYPSAKIWAPWNLRLGPAAIIGDYVECYNVAMIVVEDGAIVSQHSFLCSASHDHTREDFKLVAGPITIRRGAWVCADAFVGPGVTIGEMSILGARSVAFRTVPDGQVWAGHPASFVVERTKVDILPGVALK